MKRTYLTSHISTNDDEIKITSFHHFAIIWGGNMERFFAYYCLLKKGLAVTKKKMDVSSL